MGNQPGTPPNRAPNHKFDPKVWVCFSKGFGPKWFPIGLPERNHLKKSASRSPAAWRVSGGFPCHLWWVPKFGNHLCKPPTNGHLKDQFSRISTCHVERVSRSRSNCADTLSVFAKKKEAQMHVCLFLRVPSFFVAIKGNHTIGQLPSVLAGGFPENKTQPHPSGPALPMKFV